jgi:hypothetical protein
MADRRRSLHPNESGMSRLPMPPPSASRGAYAAQQSMRMSLAPGGARPSMGGPLRAPALGASAPPDTAPRPSVFRARPDFAQSTTRTPMQKYAPAPRPCEIAASDPPARTPRAAGR